MIDTIKIQGAKEHNLQNISVEIPKNKLVVVTGVSGSGKSSLAFDTIYAEGQRRYVESLSSYARQFLEQLQKPHVDHIEGLSPAIAIEQRTAGGSPRSIVATQTEIYDYLRLLFARIGIPHCYSCGKPVVRQTSSEIIERVLSLGKDHRIHILAPLVRGKKGTYESLFERLVKEGFRRVRVDGKTYDLDEKIKLDRYRAHTIEIVIDRIMVAPKYKQRIADSVEIALKYTQGLIGIYDETGNKEHLFNTQFSCPDCDVSFAELEPRMFSFNSPFGACPECNGLGMHLEFDPELVVSDTSRALSEGAIEPWRRGSKGYMMYYRSLLREVADAIGVDWARTPFKKIPKKLQKVVLYGDKNLYIWDKPYEGVIPRLERVFRETDSDYVKHELTQYMSKLPCPKCQGMRLKPESLAVFIAGKSIWDVVKMSIAECDEFFTNLNLSSYQQKIAYNALKEIKKRLQFCLRVGVDYLTLDRLSSSLSGGESQRIKLATQIGSALSGVIYILDEPTIGLHPRDNTKLIETLKNLRDVGNTVIVVEHDEEMIESSDWLVDLGPGAGIHGGKIVFNGPKEKIPQSSLTGQYLLGKKQIAVPAARRPVQKGMSLTVRGASEHNLKHIDIEIPLGVFVCVTGVSGSGKSTLVEDILYKTLARELYDSKEKPGEYRSIEGLKNIDKVIIVDQTPIGRTPRSNPATYTGAFTYIREVFSQLPESKVRGYKPARFSFNVSGGRCEACRGDGIKKIEMHFLPDVYVPCEVCAGHRFNNETLEIRFKGKNISDVLDMSMEEAYRLFENFPRIRNIVETLKDVGLGYIKVGQSATTLSGGEAQRIKLAAQLRKKGTGKTIYILDEPTTGLHFDDTRKLLAVLQRLVDKKNTVLVIEHNMDVVKCCDYVIDLGPGGGNNGGEVVAAGSPEDILKAKRSYTGKFLKEKL
ncbi:MAG: excinuclease ABC subunit UvrA [Candidatus Omnitrophica bacterium]|nr:excinuclease ABC subunit UvrA [Candidatus Omnitrophota bacterium]